MNTKIEELMLELKKELSNVTDLDEKIKTLNNIKLSLHEVSPFSDPVDCVLWIKSENVQANSWNPNHIAPPEMKLLYDSIKNDGYTQPIVAHRIDDTHNEVIDGYHRSLIPEKHEDIKNRLCGYLPIVPLEKTQSDRMASTIRHNRARGSHDVDLMSNIVAELIEMGKTEKWISKHLGMDLDEILRLKQITGLASLFKDNEFSKSWTTESEI